MSATQGIWTPVCLKKHPPMTLPQMAFRNPDLLFFLLEERFFRDRHAVEAQEIEEKARNIRIPQSGTQPLVAEYIEDGMTGKFVALQLVPVSFERAGMRLDRIDLSVPHQWHSRDKLGSRLLVGALKELAS